MAFGGMNPANGADAGEYAHVGKSYDPALAAECAATRSAIGTLTRLSSHFLAEFWTVFMNAMDFSAKINRDLEVPGEY